MRDRRRRSRKGGVHTVEEFGNGDTANHLFAVSGAVGEVHQCKVEDLFREGFGRIFLHETVGDRVIDWGLHECFCGGCVRLDTVDLGEACNDDTGLRRVDEVFLLRGCRTGEDENSKKEKERDKWFHGFHLLTD